MKNKAGNCEYCGRFWTAKGGGIDASGLCKQCRKKLGVDKK